MLIGPTIVGIALVTLILGTFATIAVFVSDSNRAKTVYLGILGVLIGLGITLHSQIAKALKGETKSILNVHLKENEHWYTVDPQTKEYIVINLGARALGHHERTFYDVPVDQPQYITWRENFDACGDVKIHLHEPAPK